EEDLKEISERVGRVEKIAREIAGNFKKPY
ncbi:MAG: hypothetical protein PWR09_1066, partial [Archaeoglobi archaeon]|nr:hypothetical protein [Archaeoglobi archaeon]